MVPLAGYSANTAWPRESIINSYVDAGHATRARAAAHYEAARHMRLQYDNTGRTMSLHVELALPLLASPRGIWYLSLCSAVR